MVSLPDWVVTQLLSVAQTGLKNLIPWPNDSVRVLAEQIAALVIENNMLRKLLNRDIKPEPVAENDVVFRFGPDQAYVLYVPSSKPRAQFVAQPGVSTQLDLPFSES